jgi:hypothetical protein
VTGSALSAEHSSMASGTAMPAGAGPDRLTVQPF